MFGESVSAGVAGLLADADIQTIVGARVESSSGELIVHPGEQHLRFDRVVALPRLVGPAITGLPSDADGFLPVTAHCEVTGIERVYAAGDATDFPVKYGGIAAQQADAAAASIAAVGRRSDRAHRLRRGRPRLPDAAAAICRASTSLPVSKKASHETRGPATHRPGRPRRRSPRNTSGPTWTSCGQKARAGSPVKCRWRWP